MVVDGQQSTERHGARRALDKGEEVAMNTNTSERPAAGIIGRTLRLMLGLLLGWMLFTVLRSESPAFGLRVLGIFAGITLCYTLVHLAIGRSGSRLHAWLGSTLMLLPFVVLFAAGGPSAQLAAIGFSAISLVVQTIRADAGCMLMALPALLSRRPSHLAGIVFAPIDLIERNLTGPGGLPG
jgi:predicted acyltransferase